VIFGGLMGILTNAQLMLLQVIHEHLVITGYDINKHVLNLKYKDWADIGKTSIYTGLKVLQEKKYVSSYIDMDKTGKGPLPRKYSLTEAGKEMLKSEMINTIETSREREKRLDLVISAIQILSFQDILAAFDQRMVYLNSEFIRISNDFEEQKNCLPIGGEFLYSRILSSLRNEIDFAKTVLSYYEKIAEEAI
jgi:DNA-binding PadR family transcriptional regulator